MIRLEQTSVMNFENALRGMRNPMNSWDKSDSVFMPCPDCGGKNRCILESCPHGALRTAEGCMKIGANDLDLARRLVGAGSDDRKFLRQIFVSVDVTAPLYWWKEYDTYKVGTVANSTSTMHKIHSKPFYNQMRTCTLNYENLVNIYFARRYHKLDEWHVFCDWIEGLPYFREMCIEGMKRKEGVTWK